MEAILVYEAPSIYLIIYFRPWNLALYQQIVDHIFFLVFDHLLGESLADMLQFLPSWEKLFFYVPKFSGYKIRPAKWVNSDKFTFAGFWRWTEKVKLYFAAANWIGAVVPMDIFHILKRTKSPKFLLLAPLLSNVWSCHTSYVLFN